MLQSYLKSLIRCNYLFMCCCFLFLFLFCCFFSFQNLIVVSLSIFTVIKVIIITLVIIINVSKNLQITLFKGSILWLVVPIYELLLFPFNVESQILTYEEMIRVFPDKRRKRPVVLIGNFFSCDFSHVFFFCCC